MIEKLFSSPTYDASKRLLDISLKRHEALSLNLANVESPGYKRVDLPKDFQNALRQAIQGGTGGGVAVPELVQDLDSAAQRKDGNNVVLQDELLAMNKNAAEYEVLTEFVSGSMKTLKMAILGHAQT
jgi:flagellar basal-body rod protein FlgB